MLMYDDFDRKRPRAVPLKVGLMSGLLLVLTNLVIWFAAQDVAVADLLTWILQVPVLFFAARSAAQQQVNAQMNDLNPLNGVQGTAVTAAFVTVGVMWIYTVARELVTDTSLFSSYVGIVRVPLDIFLSLGIGAFGASGVMRRYRSSQGGFYDHDDF